jgi:peptide deformylase
VQERRLSKLDARVVQHELDHLNGVLIVDHPLPPARGGRAAAADHGAAL